MSIPLRTPTFRSNARANPFLTRTLPRCPEAAYLRKSTESTDRQSKSHEQQLHEIEKTRGGPIDPDLVWSDSKSGTNFKREGFAAMYAFCEANPQPKKAPGLIWMYDESRFGRPLDEDGETDTDQWRAWQLQFKSLGWHLRFVETPVTSDPMSNDMVQTMKMHMGSQYSRDLSRKVRRGRNNWLRQGYWVGKPPWPAMRYDAAHGRLLAGTVRDASGAVVTSAEPSVNGCLLAGNPDWVAHWTWAALEVERGHSVEDVAFRLTRDRGSLTAQGNRWHQKALSDSLTNRALIGEVRWTDDDGRTHQVKAKWGPIVDVELFTRVVNVLTYRKRAHRQSRSSENQHLLDNLYCAHCGAKYFGQIRYDRHGAVVYDAPGVPSRQYRHPSVRQANLGGKEVYDRAMANGCKKWVVPATVAENHARDLLAGLRGSADWAREVEQLWSSQQGYQADTKLALTQAEARVAALNDQLGNLLSTAALMKAGSSGQQRLATQIERLSDEITQADVEVEEARERVSAASVTFGYVRELIDETRQIATVWESGDVAAKRKILDRWVSSIWVVVDQPAGARFAKSRALHYFLRTSPNDPQVVVLPRFDVKERERTAKGFFGSCRGRTFAKPLQVLPFTPPDPIQRPYLQVTLVQTPQGWVQQPRTRHASAAH